MKGVLLQSENGDVWFGYVANPLSIGICEILQNAREIHFQQWPSFQDLEWLAKRGANCLPRRHSRLGEALEKKCVHSVCGVHLCSEIATESMAH